MQPAAGILGALLLLSVAVDAFQTIILPRRPVGHLRITRLFFLLTWGPWRGMSGMLPKKQREQGYSIYGPAALLLLFIVWAVLLVTGFSLIYFGMGSPFADPLHPMTAWAHMRTAFYVSGTTLFTLGLGDVQPSSQMARYLSVTEAGTGLGFVALVIGYVPVLYTAFSQREVSVALLDARAGSPPTAAELLARHNFNGGHEAMGALLAEWERWCATMLETHISYPILCYYRSQHDNQSWLAALIAVLDTCALLITTIEGPSTRQAQLTFAVGRHVLVDLGHVFHLEKEAEARHQGPSVRLGDEEFSRLCGLVSTAGFALCDGQDSRARLLQIRKLYEPHAEAMAEFLKLELPAWTPPEDLPGKKPSVWSSVAKLRSPNALAERLTHHVSSRSTASHLEDGE